MLQSLVGLRLGSKYCVILYRPGAVHINPSLNQKIRCNLLYWGYLLYSWGSDVSFSVKFYNLAQSVHITPGSGGAGPGSVTFPVFLLLPLSQFQLPISQLVACTVLVLRWSLPGSGASSSELKILFSSWLFAGFVSVLGKTLALLGLSPGQCSVSHWRKLSTDLWLISPGLSWSQSFTGVMAPHPLLCKHASHAQLQYNLIWLFQNFSLTFQYSLHSLYLCK